MKMKIRVQIGEFWCEGECPDGDAIGMGQLEFLETYVVPCANAAVVSLQNKLNPENFLKLLEVSAATRAEAAERACDKWQEEFKYQAELINVMRADAERYRWLSTHPLRTQGVGEEAIYSDNMDEYIDAARKTAK
jgi:hypothetical protein